MLHEFIVTHRDELIARCRTKSGQREPLLPNATAADGVALFIDQLAQALRLESEAAGDDVPLATDAPSPSTIVRSAALQGEQLRQQGFRLGQVVHAYGDVCQSVTDLALAHDQLFSTREFRTLNRCLDDAIAGAVAAHGALDQREATGREADLQRQLRILSNDHQRLVAISIHAFSAIRAGNVGVKGATGALLGHSLDELSRLVEHGLAPMLDAPAPPAD